MQTLLIHTCNFSLTQNSENHSNQWSIAWWIFYYQIQAALLQIYIYFFFYSRRCILISDENKPGRCWKEFLQWTQRRYSNQIYSCNNYSILSTGPSYLVLLVFLIFKIRLECNESSRKLKLCYQFTYECRILSTISTDRLWLSLLLLVRFSY